MPGLMVTGSLLSSQSQRSLLNSMYSYTQIHVNKYYLYSLSLDCLNLFYCILSSYDTKFNVR